MITLNCNSRCGNKLDVNHGVGRLVAVNNALARTALQFIQWPSHVPSQPGIAPNIFCLTSFSLHLFVQSDRLGNALSNRDCNVYYTIKRWESNADQTAWISRIRRLKSVVFTHNY